MFSSGLFSPNHFSQGYYNNDGSTSTGGGTSYPARGGFDRGIGGPGFSDGVGLPLQPIASGE